MSARTYSLTRLVSPESGLYMLNFFAALRRRLRCFLITGGMHELDLSMGRCRYCRVDWDRLYKPNPSSKNGHE